jgi:nitrite reductase/ring-hydroxylating ferredoxin subunit
VFVRIGQAAEVGEGLMRVFVVEGSKVNISNIGGGLYAFDDTCTHMG